jgi:hypothetical protein
MCTSLLLDKTKNRLLSQYSQPCNRKLDRGSDHFTDSDYFEISQKFTTLSDCKLLDYGVILLWNCSVDD